ncbi:hypothetical protein DEO72_LG7g1066 [Vigna unguiculata]|uniref:Uncharacterized protein n=1 Tax=Vigna unguiculata TaxID=3917 RepID=A0A4D6MGA4_VIGUN|nr:hypothetical protein DEO72_LG7g1066 [Vigna unguiculata]
MVAEAVWLEARQFRGNTTLVEEEEGLAWWWRVAGTVVERERDTVQLERRLAGAAWPEARRDGGSTTMVEEEGGLVWWCRRNSCRERWRRCSARGRRRGVRIFVL